jgi:hypothetical protein
MAKRELISKKTRIEFREHFVGSTLREISQEFDAADVPYDADYVSPEPGQRRSLVEQYYHAVCWGTRGSMWRPRQWRYVDSLALNTKLISVFGSCLAARGSG